jgi:hypothetical protein
VGEKVVNDLMVSELLRDETDHRGLVHLSYTLMPANPSHNANMQLVQELMMFVQAGPRSEGNELVILLPVLSLRDADRTSTLSISRAEQNAPLMLLARLWRIGTHLRSFGLRGQ